MSMHDKEPIIDTFVQVTGINERSNNFKKMLKNCKMTMPKFYIEIVVQPLFIIDQEV